MWSIHVTRFVVGKSLGKIMLHVRCFSKFVAVMRERDGVSVGERGK